MEMLAAAGLKTAVGDRTGGHTEGRAAVARTRKAIMRYDTSLPDIGLHQLTGQSAP